MSIDDQVTVLIPTSPIPRHPSTDLIEACVMSIRTHLPDARIIIMADGVRPQVEHRRLQYESYKDNLAGLCNSKKLGSTEFHEFPEFSQQANMTRRTLQDVTTPLMMFVEHDVIFRQEPIAFPTIFKLLQSGEANLVRFYSWADIWWEHEYLMKGEFQYEGSRFVKTVQYSQWPLVSTSDYHRRILNEYFSVSGQYAMIESVMYGPVVAAPWEKNKIVIYLDGHIVFHHKDGRTDEQTGVRDPGSW